MPLPFLNNPFLFAAVAVVAIGIVVYEVISRQEEKKMGNRGRKPPARSPPSSPIRYPTSPKSSDSGPRGSDSADRNNTVRKRQLDQHASKPNSSEVTKRKIDTATSGNVNENSVTSKDEQGNRSNLPSSACNQNVYDKKFDEKNYEKNVLDKITNDTKGVDSNVKRKVSLVKNICEEDSDSSENNEKKLNNTDISGQCGQSFSNSFNKQQSTQSSLLQSAASSDSECSDRSSSLDPKEEIYKTEVRNALKNDVDSKSKNVENPYGSSSECSVGTVRSVKSTNTFMYTESSTCRGCEEKPVNTRLHPCNHRYLCYDCAVRIFRLHKKCSICHNEVVEYVVFDP